MLNKTTNNVSFDDMTIFKINTDLKLIALTDQEYIYRFFILEKLCQRINKNFYLSYSSKKHNWDITDYDQTELIEFILTNMEKTYNPLLEGFFFKSF